jgi:hypothetical protein
VTALVTTTDAGAALPRDDVDSEETELYTAIEPPSFGPFEADDESQLKTESAVQREAYETSALEPAIEDMRNSLDVEHDQGKECLPMFTITSASTGPAEPLIIHEIHLEAVLEEPVQFKEPTPITPDTPGRPVTNATQAHASVSEGDESTLVEPDSDSNEVSRTDPYLRSAPVCSQGGSVDGNPNKSKQAASLQSTVEDDEGEGEPTDEEVKRAEEAVRKLARCETDLRKLNYDLQDHFATHQTQFAKWCEAQPYSDDDLSMDAFGQEYTKRGANLTKRVTAAEEALRQARIEAKEADVMDPNSPDQTSGFLSAADDGHKPEVSRFLINTCDRMRIRKWQEAPLKRKVMQKSEFKFATSGADVDTWDSPSARGDSSKRRKIDDIDYAWVRNKATGDSEQLDEKERSREREASHISKQKPRARSEVVRRRKRLSSDPRPDPCPDYKFDFVYPPVKQTVSDQVSSEKMDGC